MQLLRRRNSCIRYSQVAAINTSHVATFGGALAAGDLILYLQRYAAATHDVAPSGFDLLGYHDGFGGTTSGIVAAGIAAGGETAITGPDKSTDRSCAIAYKGCRIAQAVNISSESYSGGGGANTTGLIPALTLKDPGRSWVVGVSISGTGNTASATTAPQWRLGSGEASNFLNIVDSGGPVQSWPGYTITYGVSTLWSCWSLEIVSL